MLRARRGRGELAQPVLDGASRPCSPRPCYAARARAGADGRRRAPAPHAARPHRARGRCTTPATRLGARSPRCSARRARLGRARAAAGARRPRTAPRRTRRGWCSRERAPRACCEAAGRRLELGGAPLLMGIVNATPDSFSDAGELPDLEARVARARRAARPRARRCSTSAASRPSGGRPPVPAEEEIARVVPGDRADRRGARRADLRRHLQAGGRRGGGRGGRGDGQRRLGPARPGARGALRAHRRRRWWSCTRASRRRARCSTRTPTTTSWPTCATSSRERMRARRGGRRAGRSRSCSTPAPTSPRRPRRRSRCCARLDVLHALGRPLLLPVSRKDFLGAITGRAAARARRRARSPRSRWAADAGAHVLRVHDVAAAADFLAVRAVLRGRARARADRGPDARPLPGRHAALASPERSLAWSRTGCRSLRTTRPDADRPTQKEFPMSSVLDRDALEPRARSPICTCSPTSSASTASAASARPTSSTRSSPASPATPTATAAERRGRARRGRSARRRRSPQRRRAARRRPRRPTADAERRRRRAEERPTRRRGRGDDEAEEDGATDEDAPARGRRGRRGGRGRGRAGRATATTASRARGAARPRTASSRASSSCSATAPPSSASARPEPTDDDVYVSAAQVKRCELVSGDRIAGPVRAPRRSERFPSLVRVDTINGAPGRRGRRGHALRGPARRLAVRAPRARLRGRHAQGGRVAHAVRQGLARA